MTCALPRSRPCLHSPARRRGGRCARLVDRGTEGVGADTADDVELATLASRLAETGYALTDITADLARYLNGLDVEPHGSNRLPRAAPS